MLLALNAFYAATNIFELFLEDWFEDVSKLASVGSVLAALLLFIGFLIMAIGSTGTRRNDPSQVAVGVAADRQSHSEQGSLGSHAEPGTTELRLSRLKDLRDKGLVSAEEFEQNRARILASL